MKNERAGCGRRRRANATRNNRGAYLPGLRTCRTLSALTQRELAERIGSSQSTVCDLENARRGAFPRTIRRLTAALDVEPADLLYAQAITEGEE